MPAKVCAGLVLCLFTLNMFAVKVGDSAPSWSGTTIDTQATVEFPNVLDGKPAVFIFWATWCPYCKAFMPYAKQIQLDYADQGVKVIAFNDKERGKGDPQAYVESLDFPLIAIADADPIADTYGVKFLPGLMVVSGDAVIAYRRGWTDLPAGTTVAEQWSGEVRAVLDYLLP